MQKTTIAWIQIFLGFWLILAPVLHAGAADSKPKFEPIQSDEDEKSDAGSADRATDKTAEKMLGSISTTKTGEAKPAEEIWIRGVQAKEVSGVVRLIRANPETEVFFKDLKDSLIIPKDSGHNKIYAACEESQKKGKPVKLLIDPVGRRILSLPNPPEKTESGAGDSSK